MTGIGARGLEVESRALSRSAMSRESCVAGLLRQQGKAAFMIVNSRPVPIPARELLRSRRHFILGLA